MEFKELTTEELSQGFVRTNDGDLVCIFCGERFQEGVIYNSEGRMVTAERAVKEHIEDVHQGVFFSLIDLDKQINGLSDSQKEILTGMYLEKDNKEMSEELDISPATVRTHKFNIQKMKREAKILLAILEQIENENLAAERKKIRESGNNIINKTRELHNLDRQFTGNSLHPFFTQFILK